MSEQAASVVKLYRAEYDYERNQLEVREYEEHVFAPDPEHYHVFGSRHERVAKSSRWQGYRLSAEEAAGEYLEQAQTDANRTQLRLEAARRLYREVVGPTRAKRATPTT